MFPENTYTKSHLNWAVYGAAAGKHITFMETLIGQGALLDYVIAGVMMGAYLEEEEGVLDFLVSIKDLAVRQAFVNEMNKSDINAYLFKENFCKLKKRITYDIKTLFNKSCKIDQLMNIRTLSFKQACVWLASKDLRNWFSVCSLFESRLSSDLYFMMTRYFCTTKLSKLEMEELKSKMYPKEGALPLYDKKDTQRLLKEKPICQCFFSIKEKITRTTTHYCFSEESPQVLEKRRSL